MSIEQKRLQLHADEILRCRCRADESWLADCSRAVVQRFVMNAFYSGQPDGSTAYTDVWATKAIKRIVSPRTASKACYVYTIFLAATSAITCCYKTHWRTPCVTKTKRFVIGLEQKTHDRQRCLVCQLTVIVDLQAVFSSFHIENVQTEVPCSTLRRYCYC